MYFGQWIKLNFFLRILEDFIIVHSNVIFAVCDDKKENKEFDFKNRIRPQANNLRSSPIYKRSQILRAKDFISNNFT